LALPAVDSFSHDVMKYLYHLDILVNHHAFSLAANDDEMSDLSSDLRVESCRLLLMSDHCIYPILFRPHDADNRCDDPV
jgi:hypothetical protein